MRILLIIVFTNAALIIVFTNKVIHEITFQWFTQV